jgi:2-dehydropantoate 2-reductase
MRICVFGAGAIGGHLAARLAAAGHEVCAVARGANLEALRDRGIMLHAGEGKGDAIAGRLRASDRPAELGPQDAVFVTTKATALSALADAAAALSGPDTSFVFVQNGMPWWYAQGLGASRPKPPDLSRLDPGGALAKNVPPQSVVGAVVYSSNEVVEPGVVENFSPGRNMLVMGAPDDRPSARVDALRKVLEDAGMPSPATADIRQSVWDKLLVNFGSTLCVPLGEPFGAVINDPALRAVRERLMAEGRAVAAAHGVAFTGLPKRPGPAGAAATSHKPSMLTDYEMGRPMEVEAILAAPQAFARAAGVETPALDALAALTMRLAAAKGLYA